MFFRAPHAACYLPTQLDVRLDVVSIQLPGNAQPSQEAHEQNCGILDRVCEVDAHGI